MIYKIKGEIYTIMKSVQKVTVTTAREQCVCGHTLLSQLVGEAPQAL